MVNNFWWYMQHLRLIVLAIAVGIFSVILNFPASAWGQISTAIIPADRLPPPGTWSAAGVEGGIPNTRTNICDVTKAPYLASNIGGPGAVAAIQAAINSCNDGVVLVPAGNYTIDGKIVIKNSVTLRGAGPTTVFNVTSSSAILVGGLSPWPPPKANPTLSMPVLSGASRGSTSITVANTSTIEVGKMIMLDEIDDPSLVWNKSGTTLRSRASMHMVESKTASSVVFRPPLPITYVRTPQLSRFPDLTSNVGIENIKFVGVGTSPSYFIDIESAWNIWVSGCEFTNHPSKVIFMAWSGHVELRKNYLHDQSNGGPNSEGLDLFADVSWSSIIDNICVAAGFPQINIGDGGANPYYSGGFGNVIAYNYCQDSFYTDPPTSLNHGKMTADISTNHSPHTQYNLVEGNFAGKFGVDSYHGSGSHTVLFRNVFTGRNRWTTASYRTAVQLDRRNLFYSVVGNVLGEVGSPTTYEFVNTPWNDMESTIFRLGFPNVGNDVFSGTFPPTSLPFSDGGPRDLYVDRNTSSNGTTIIEGNWTSKSGQSWSIVPATLPDSLFLSSKPNWFGSLKWPPVDPQSPKTTDPGIIPAGYRFLHGIDPPPSSNSGPSSPRNLSVQTAAQ